MESQPLAMTRLGLVGITSEPIDCPAVLSSVRDDQAGAVVSFAGVIRNHDLGRQVKAITYTAHPLADDMLSEVVAGFRHCYGVHAIAVQHRIGHLEVGDLALYVALAASHRAQAFDCIEELIDQIKKKVPIWKNQYFADGSHEWSGCP